MSMTSYTVTARTPEGEIVYLDVAANGWLVMVRSPVYHAHGPRLKEIVWASVLDPHLTNVTVNQMGEK